MTINKLTENGEVWFEKKVETTEWKFTEEQLVEKIAKMKVRVENYQKMLIEIKNL